MVLPQQKSRAGGCKGNSSTGGITWLILYVHLNCHGASKLLNTSPSPSFSFIIPFSTHKVGIPRTAYHSLWKWVSRGWLWTRRGRLQWEQQFFEVLRTKQKKPGSGHTVLVSSWVAPGLKLAIAFKIQCEKFRFPVYSWVSPRHHNKHDDLLLLVWSDHGLQGFCVISGPVTNITCQVLFCGGR